MSLSPHDEACVRQLVAQYFQLVEPRDLCVPSADAIVNPAVQAAIYERMFNQDTLWPIPPASYRTRVLKMILSRIEESISNPEEDVRTPLHDVLPNRFTRLLPSRVSCPHSA